MTKTKRNRGTKAPPPKPPVPKIDNTELLRETGLKLLHIRPSERQKGMTLAYRERNNRVEVATSITHAADCFTKKIGAKTAIEHFTAGRTIVLPLLRTHDGTHYPKKSRAVISLKAMFNW